MSDKAKLAGAAKLKKPRTRPKRKKAKPRVSRARKFKDAPHYTPVRCPKDTPEKNLQWRRRWFVPAMTDRGLQRDLRQAAFEDILFWFNAFCFCFEPRAAVKVRPFSTWEHQDPVIITLDNAITDSERSEAPIDVVVDKSRGQGATWIYLLIFLRRWLRDPLFSAGLVTRNESLVDSLRDPDTLMWKIVWMIKMLPTWMLPEGFDVSKNRSVSEHSLANPSNGASIVGYAATGDVARGGRKSVFAMDEFAAFRPGEDYAALNSTQHVTNCRFLVSTHLGDSGAYYDAATQDSNAIKVVMDWKDNPTQNAKLFRIVHGKYFESDPKKGNKLGMQDFEILKDQHTKLRRRGFKIEDKLRNSWYNEQCLRPGATVRGIAQELDRDPSGSVAKVFSSEVLKDAEKLYAQPPLLQGRLVYDSETAKVKSPFIVPTETGELKLWIRPGLDGEMPAGVFVLGADISAGTAGSYSSNSVACVINKMTGEQVAEWASNSVVPIKFAYVCAALGYWFHGAEIIPEANFGAGYMTAMVEDICYQNLYYREMDIVGLHKKTKKAGFWMAKDDDKLKLFEALQEGMADGRFIPRSEALLKECPEYEWKNAKIIHNASTRTDDEASKGKAHGDRVIAAALAWMRCVTQPGTDSEETARKAPVGSMAERLQVRDRELRQDGDPWGDNRLDIFQGSCSDAKDPWR